MQPSASSFFLIEELLKISGKKSPDTTSHCSLAAGKEDGVLLFTSNHFTVINIKDIF